MTVIETPIGKIRLTESEGAITGLEYVNARTPLSEPKTPLLKKAVKQLRRYFKQPSTSFDLPLEAAGTDFQQRVWQALRQIPVGQKLTYGELATKLSTGPRAVGNACRQNPIALIVPCHRVVSSQGIGGYAGKTQGVILERKRHLLAHEGIHY